MTANKLKDADLAARLEKLSRSQISRIRRGKCNPKPEAALELERVTKIPAAKFVMGLAGEKAEQAEAAA